MAEKFPIYSVIPIAKFAWDDGKSMTHNNTSGFNYRSKTAGVGLSRHAYGQALDLNPVYNPYVKGNVILPAGATYVKTQPGTLTDNSPIVKTFLKLGWTWGGYWRTLKDYQHFEKTLE